MTLSARLLLPADEAQADEYLKPHTPFAFYMRSNMKAGGLVYEGKTFQADFFGAFDAGQLVGVLQHGWIGNVQVFADTLSIIPSLVEAWRGYRAQNPREIEAFLGPAKQVDQVLASSGITRADLREREDDERLFALSLKKLIVPAVLNNPQITLRQARKSDIAILATWRHDFNVEAIGDAPGLKTHDKAKDEIARRVGEGDLFVLEDRGERVSFCGVGGFLPDWNCVGPVWTPPEKRGRGYGRAVTAGALLALRNKGVENALLFAHRLDAVKAYCAIGFESIGDWRLDYLINPVGTL